MVWPTRKESFQTAAAVFGFVVLMALFLWIVRQGARGGSCMTSSSDGKSDDQALVRRPRLLGLREVGPADPRGAHPPRGHAGQVRQDPRPDRGGRRDEGRPEAHVGAQVLPRLRAGRDGDGRRGLAPGEEHRQGDRIRRRRARRKPPPITEKEVDAIMQQMQEGVEKPKPKVLFEIGEAVRVKEGPFTDFHGHGGGRELRQEQACACRSRFSAARRRWSWSSVRSRRPEDAVASWRSCGRRAIVAAQ